MSVITVHQLTRDYGNGKGVFDLSLSIERGEVFGFLGPNGAGKTTTIRHLMGFMTADKGSCRINGLDCKRQAHTIQAKLGYIPGEISFMDEMTGDKFIAFMASYRGLNNLSKAKQLMERFELNAKGKLKRMSKGMKQKIGIICAFMHDPDVLILDEPTSGLDPLMQHRFIELILEEKEKGKTILMSSHIFDEVERTCDRVAIIKNGKLVAVNSIEALKASKRKTYCITLLNAEEAAAFCKEPLMIESCTGNIVTVTVQNDANQLIACLANYTVLSIDTLNQSLEQIFIDYYGGEPNA